MAETALSADGKVEGSSTTILPGVVYSASSDPGVGLEENQDAYTVLETDNFKVFMVADGMGSASHGRDIALRALSSIQFSLHQCGTLDEAEIRKSLVKANRDVLTRAAELKDAGNLAATLLGLAFTPDKTFVINAGNSRLYRLRAGEITQLSKDHTVEGQLRRGRGETRPLPAGSRPAGHLLTSALGLSQDIELDVDVIEEPPQVADVYILCTDGLYDVLTEARMRATFQADAPFKKIVRRLVSDARKQGSTDNITALALRIESVPANYVSQAKVAVVTESVAETVEPVVPTSDKPDKELRVSAAEAKIQHRVNGSGGRPKASNQEPIGQGPALKEATVPSGERVSGASEDAKTSSMKADATLGTVRKSDSEESLERRGRTFLGASASSGEQPKFPGSDRSEQQKQLRKSFNPSSLQGVSDVKSSRASDPFAEGHHRNGTNGKGPSAAFSVPTSFIKEGSWSSTGRFVGAGVVVLVVALFGASWMASQLRFQNTPPEVVAKVAAPKAEVAPKTKPAVKKTEMDEFLVEAQLSKEEAERLLALAREVQRAESMHTYRVLLDREPVLSFDKIRNVELRNLMLNVYSAIQQAVVEGEHRTERLNEESLRLAESVDRLSVKLIKLEEDLLLEGNAGEVHS